MTHENTNITLISGESKYHRLSQQSETLARDLETEGTEAQNKHKGNTPKSLEEGEVDLLALFNGDVSQKSKNFA